jgi:hypothetical protein
MKEYEVQADSIEDFAKRYYKPRDYERRGPDYVEAVLESHRRYLAKYGYCLITHHASITGEIVTYYGSKKEDRPNE